MQSEAELKAAELQLRKAEAEQKRAEQKICSHCTMLAYKPGRPESRLLCYARSPLGVASISLRSGQWQGNKRNLVHIYLEPGTQRGDLLMKARVFCKCFVPLALTLFQLTFEQHSMTFHISNVLDHVPIAHADLVHLQMTFRC